MSRKRKAEESTWDTLPREIRQEIQDFRDSGRVQAGVTPIWWGFGDKPHNRVMDQPGNQFNRSSFIGPYQTLQKAFKDVYIPAGFNRRIFHRRPVIPDDISAEDEPYHNHFLPQRSLKPSEKLPYPGLRTAMPRNQAAYLQDGDGEPGTEWLYNAFMDPNNFPSSSAELPRYAHYEIDPTTHKIADRLPEEDPFHESRKPPRKSQQGSLKAVKLPVPYGIAEWDATQSNAQPPPLNGTGLPGVPILLRHGGSLKSVGRAFRRGIGSFAQSAKKIVPRAVTKDLVLAGAAASSAFTANPAVGRAILAAALPAVDAAYETNLAHGSVGKNFVKNYVKDFTQDGVQLLL